MIWPYPVNGVTHPWMSNGPQTVGKGVPVQSGFATRAAACGTVTPVHGLCVLAALPELREGVLHRLIVIELNLSISAAVVRGPMNSAADGSCRSGPPTDSEPNAKSQIELALKAKR